MLKVDLLIIDPQNDFTESGDAKNNIPMGSLYVGGAEGDITRVAELIDKYGRKLNDIHVTLDCHHLIDIAHPLLYVNSERKHPDPFTIITNDDLERGVWTTIAPAYMDRVKAYTAALEKGKRYPLCIWPPHCLIGSWGNAIYPRLYDSLLNWETEQLANVDKVTKGSNPWTEHYSAVMAEVPDPTDPTTNINKKFIETLEDVDELLLTGEALSHCLANTVRDIANNFASEDSIKKMVLLEDASSSVGGFENFGDDFISEMTARGMRVAKTTDYLP